MRLNVMDLRMVHMDLRMVRMDLRMVYGFPNLFKIKVHFDKLNNTDSFLQCNGFDLIVHFF